MSINGCDDGTVVDIDQQRQLASSSSSPESDDESEIPLVDFLKHSRTQLHHEEAIEGFVFWSHIHFDHDDLSSDIPSLIHEATDDRAISQKIIYALRELLNCLCLRPVQFVQFWAVEEIGGRRLLTTIDQPFFTSQLTKKICEYRIHSMNYKYNLNECSDQEVENEEKSLVINGPPASAFLSQLPEASSSLRRQSLKGYPLLSLARKCGVQAYMVMPIFQPSTSSCVGVLEFSMWSPISLYEIWDDMKCILKGIGLRSYDVQEHIPYIAMGGLQHAKDELIKALKAIGKVVRFRLAQAWISYRDKNHLLAAKLVHYHYLYESDADEYMYFGNICNMVPLKMGQGLVGMTFQLRKPWYCEDLSVLTNKQPLSPTARLVATCFTIPLISSYTGSFEYVLEFLWDKSRYTHHMILLESIIGTLKLHLPSFEVASGEELSSELCVLYIKHSLENDLETIPICKVVISPEKEGNVLEEQVTINGNVVLQHTRRNDILTRKHKTAPISLSLEAIKQQYGKTQREAAASLKVCLSTMKRKCKEYRIYEWPGPKTIKVKEIESHGKGEHSNNVNIAAIHDKLDMNEDPVQDANTLTIKVKYLDDVIKFKLPFATATLRAVEEEIAKSFENLGSFRLKYKDADGDLISIICDRHLRDYIESSYLSNMTTIHLLVHPLTT